MRWIQRYVPEFERRWNRFTRPAGLSWRVDETYVKIKGRWTYLYRAVDKEGKTVDFPAARQAGRRSRQGILPASFQLPGQTCRIRSRSMAIRPLVARQKRLSANIRREINAKGIRSSKYLNNLIEQDHRSIKLRLGPIPNPVASLVRRIRVGGAAIAR